MMDEEEDEEEYKDKKKKKEEKKSEAPDPVLSALTELRAEISQLKSSVIVEPPTHPLHESLEKFKSDYDSALEMSDLSADDKLRLIQQSFDSLGQQVIETIKAPQIAKEPSPVNDMVNAFSEALRPLMQEMGMINARLSSMEAKPIAKSVVQVPQRRSITPTLQMQSEVRTGVSSTVKKSETPNLRAIIERTT